MNQPTRKTPGARPAADWRAAYAPLILCLILLASPALAQAPRTLNYKDSLKKAAARAPKNAKAPEAPLLGKWIVRAIQRDGVASGAQIGQKVGDVITIRKDGNHVDFG